MGKFKRGGENNQLIGVSHAVKLNVEIVNRMWTHQTANVFI